MRPEANKLVQKFFFIQMNILETIVQHKYREVAQRRQAVPVAQLRQQPGYERLRLSLRQFILDPTRTGIIAEFKRQSPSKGIINADADVAAVTKAYAQHGASAISVLTDTEFFGGSTADLEAARLNAVPLLRKDFIVDAYQIEEARAMGADAILLIAACLTPAAVSELAAYAKELGLEVLLELHAEEELNHVCPATDIVGINNRDLKTFTVDIERSLQMAARLPHGVVKIAESGISTPAEVKRFRENGFDGFLIGERFMRDADPGAAFAAFVESLKPE